MKGELLDFLIHVPKSAEVCGVCVVHSNVRRWSGLP